MPATDAALFIALTFACVMIAWVGLERAANAWDAWRVRRRFERIEKRLEGMWK